MVIQVTAILKAAVKTCSFLMQSGRLLMSCFQSYFPFPGMDGMFLLKIPLDKQFCMLILAARFSKRFSQVAAAACALLSRKIQFFGLHKPALARRPTYVPEDPKRIHSSSRLGG